ncbi:DUF547 domain-containing protein [Daejeonella oryzae]|uniref:DUF547 domain-containing protein n=1 Tax=Daejeonella oryzae TaxID=1122943 RepID=UPI0004795A17|nr:DUF547 domain-containing protein [Daejeonella oryzae]
MIKTYLYIFLLILISSQSCISNSKESTTSSKPVDHKIWNELLKMHVSSNGNVNYKGFKKDRNKLDSYLKLLSSANVSGQSKNERLAYWINAYNAFTIDLIISNYPVKSIKDIRNAKSLVAKATGDSQVWVEKLRYPFNGEELSLHSIESKKLLKDLFDPRIHFAINCASYSCPRLWNQAFTAANVQQAMDNMAVDFINDPRKNKLSAKNVQLSEIFKWYKNDFTRTGSLIDFINKFSKTKISRDAEINYIPYNWNLNE